MLHNVNHLGSHYCKGADQITRVYNIRQGPRLTLKKSGGRTKYLKSGISTLTADISAKCHCFHQSGAFLEPAMHKFSEFVEKLKKNSLT